MHEQGMPHWLRTAFLVKITALTPTLLLLLWDSTVWAKPSAAPSAAPSIAETSPATVADASTESSALSASDLLGQLTPRFERFEDHSFDFSATHPDYAVQICRRKDATVFALPRHHVVLIGTGDRCKIVTSPPVSAA